MEVDSGGCPFSRFLRRLAGQNDSSNKDFVEESPLHYSSVGKGSVIGNDGEMFMDSEEYVRDDGSLLSLQPWIFRREDYKDDWERITENAEFSGKCAEESSECVHTELSPRITGTRQGFDRNRSFGRSRGIHGYSMKSPVTIENCLVPWLFKDIEVEDYVLSSIPISAAPIFRSFLVTDGTRIISKSSYNGSDLSPVGLHKEIDGVASSVPYRDGSHRGTDKVVLGVIGSVAGIPPLPEARRPRRKSRKGTHGGLEGDRSGKPPGLQHSQGSLDGLLLFCFGISVGLFSTFLSNKREVEKMNNKLKHSKHLVEDLQEELEMKDSITVQQLANHSESQYLKHYSSRAELINSSQSQVQMSRSNTDEQDQQHLSVTRENSNSLSKIEAELEAELERLEQNMKASPLELDADLIADAVHGELRTDMLAHGIEEDQTYANTSSGTSTTDRHDANYAVSPKELTLCLQEVIQARLEERIEELERALHQNQRQLQCLEAKRVSSYIAFSSSEPGSCSNQESPRITDQDGALIHPFCINLSGDALDAYDEAYEEFVLMADMEEDLPSSTIAGADWSKIWHSENGGVKASPNTKPSREDGGDFTVHEEGKKLIQEILYKGVFGC